MLVGAAQAQRQVEVAPDLVRAIGEDLQSLVGAVVLALFLIVVGKLLGRESLERSQHCGTLLSHASQHLVEAHAQLREQAVDVAIKVGSEFRWLQLSR